MMAQGRDSKGRFSSSASAGMTRGRQMRAGRTAGATVVRNLSSVAKSTGQSIAGAGVKVSPKGAATVAGRPVSGASARAVARKVSSASRTKALKQFKAMPKSEQRRVTRSQRRYLGVK